MHLLLQNTNEVAVLLVDEEKGPRDIVIYTRGGRVLRVSELHRAYDSLKYPFMFPLGNNGYCINNPQINPSTGHDNPYKKVSCF